MSEAAIDYAAEGIIAEEDRIEGVDYCAGGWPTSCICGTCQAISTIYGWLWKVREWGLPVTRATCPECKCHVTLTRPPFGRPIVNAPVEQGGDGRE